jgi:Na+-transporting NADH:ubiquinone oxidoreductase subunit NqrC
MIEINQSLILIIIILSVISLIIVFLLLAVLRRISSKKKYEELDRQRKIYGGKVRNLLDSGKAFQDRADLLAPPKSIKWQAIEEVLLNLIDEERDRENVKRLVDKMGYIKFYEKRLKSKNRIAKASAIDKLGKMLSHSSTEKLIEVLKKENNVEIISVTIRALSRIGSPVALKGIMEQLPDLVNKSLVSRKIIEAS